MAKGVRWYVYFNRRANWDAGERKVGMVKALIPVGIGLFLTVNSLATTHYVDLNSTNPVPPYTNWVSAATNIQDAVNSASDFDVIVVSDGHYLLSSPVNVSKSLTVQSLNGPQNTIVDGQGSVQGFLLIGYQTTLSGFTVTNGYSDYRSGIRGGGIYCDELGVVVSNCVIVGNRVLSSGTGTATAYGGGVSGGTIKNCTITSNEADQDNFFEGSNNYSYGGGAHGCYLIGCIISNNYSAGSGGGAHKSSFSDCRIVNNYAKEHGGGFYTGHVTDSVIQDNICLGNGGGGYDAIRVGRCKFIGNSALFDGGGLYTATNRLCVMRSSIFVDNYAGRSGGAACGFTPDSLELKGCTILDNYAAAEGAALYKGKAFNCIIYHDQKSPVSNMFEDSPQVSFSCTPVLYHGALGNITNAPHFVDSASGNYRLEPSSPCIDAGSNFFVSEYEFDFDVYLRIAGGTVDMGAYEYQGGSAEDTDGDGLSDAEEFQRGTDPDNPDSDSDGFDDGFEVGHGMDALVADAWIVPYVTNNASTFGIDCSGGVIDVALGQMLLETTNGEARMSLQLLQSDDLATWTNAGNKVEWMMPMETNKQFFRVRAER